MLSLLNGKMLEEYREYELETMMQVKHWYNRNCVFVSVYWRVSRAVFVIDT